MEQNMLRDLEHRCIQEEPPYCQTACPLKVDARAFCAAMAQERFDEARKILAKTMSLSDILGRICDHPCQSACIRAETGGAVELGRLERACLERTSPAAPPLRLPAKGKTVTVLGGGLSSLVCACELAKKGYRVLLGFTGTLPGGRLLSLPEETLPQNILAETWAFLQKLGVTRSSEEPLSLPALREGEAAYLGMDDPALAHLSTVGAVDSATYETTIEGLFAGGFLRNGSSSPVWEAADGKRAANSLDRFLQGASLSSGREKEISNATRLHTPLRDVASIPPRNDPAEEAQRCLQCECRHCVRECVFLETYKRYPRAYAREIYNNFAVVQGYHQANRMINSCALCGLCETLCPNDFSMADLCRAAREELVERGLMPPSAHEFALLDMDHANGPRAAGFRPGRTATKALFFPGCQLAGTMPEQTEALVSFLDERFSGTLGVLLGCCGAPAWWAGRRDMLQKVLDTLRETLKSLGNPPLILACSSCGDVFRRLLPETSFLSLWEVLREKGLPPGHPLPNPLALHDPCTTRSLPAWRNAVRDILRALGQPFEELSMTGETTRCCGYGGLQSLVDPDLAKKGVRRRLEESDKDFLAYCAMCRESLSDSGKPVAHLLDLFFPPEAPYEAVGFSARQTNREQLRRRLLGTCDLPPDPWEDVDLIVSPDVRRCLEERHILDSDLRRTLWEASNSARLLVSPEGRMLATSRIGNVTFWVEYRTEGASFRIVNAWSHRMTVEVLS
jgi:Fe-S oxidoreductase